MSTNHEVEILDVPAAYLVKFGLETPLKRFIVLSSLAGTVAYVTKVQSNAFRKDGSAKPLKMLAPQHPDAVSPFGHFLTAPVVGSFLFVALFT